MDEYRKKQQERWQKENSRGSSEPLGVSIPTEHLNSSVHTLSPTTEGSNASTPIVIDDHHLQSPTKRTTTTPFKKQSSVEKRRSLPQQSSTAQQSSSSSSATNSVFSNLYNNVKNFFQKPKPNQSQHTYQTIPSHDIEEEKEDEEDVVMNEASESSRQQSSSQQNQDQLLADEELARQLQEDFDREAEQEREQFQRVQQNRQQQQQQQPQQRRNRSFFELFNEEDPFENFNRLMRDLQRAPQYHPLHHDSEDDATSFLEEFVSLPRPNRQRVPIERLFGPHPMTLQQLQSQFGGNFIISYPNSMGFLDPSSMSYDELLRLQERIGNVNRGINQNQIEANTSSYKLDKDLDEQCNVCLEKFKKDESVRRLPCLHLYHSDCIDNWLQQNKTCPVCRKDVTEAPN